MDNLCNKDISNDLLNAEINETTTNIDTLVVCKSDEGSEFSDFSESVGSEIDYSPDENDYTDTNINDLTEMEKTLYDHLDKGLRKSLFETGLPEAIQKLVSYSVKKKPSEYKRESYKSMDGSALMAMCMLATETIRMSISQTRGLPSEYCENGFLETDIQNINNRKKKPRVPFFHGKVQEKRYIQE